MEDRLDIVQRIVPPVWPWRGARNTDGYGSGVFMASRDGGARRHLGLDCITVPGDAILAVFPGKIGAIGWAYPDGQLASLWLEGEDEWRWWKAQYLYTRVLRDLKVGVRVGAGEVIADADDLTAYYRRKHPERTDEITNHIHLMLLAPVNPTVYLPEGLRT